MRKAQEQRPPIATLITSAELRCWYWLKSELWAEAKRVGVKSTGAKFTLLERLCHQRDTGQTIWPGDVAVVKKSKFDWHSAPLTLHTPITDNYKNTQNVRRFFQQHADAKFKFNIAFMEWLKANVGKTLGDAVAYWQAQNAAASRQPKATDIKRHNQFNQYVRDFIAANPALGMAGARKHWALKRALPSATGLHRYEPSDLELT